MIGKNYHVFATNESFLNKTIITESSFCVKKIVVPRIRNQWNQILSELRLWNELGIELSKIKANARMELL
jgi:hypothetical protein